MENKPAQNIQETFLNTARKERTNITIYLLSGVKLTGRIRSFDKYSVVLETNNQEQLIFKHAISTVAMGQASARSWGQADGDALRRRGTARSGVSCDAAAPGRGDKADREASGTRGLASRLSCAEPTIECRLPCAENPTN